MFRNRSWLPVPLAILLVILSRGREPAPVAAAVGLAVALGGEWLRLWAVRHIGTVSRTRSTRMGPFITTGPYAFVRNPLYVGNLLLWTGVVITSSVYWMLPVTWVAFAAQYTFIVAWEERLMRAQYPHYRAYQKRVPAWVPRLRLREAPHVATPVVRRKYRWSEVLFSERGTLMALAVMMTVLFVGANRLGHRPTAPASARALRVATP